MRTLFKSQELWDLVDVGYSDKEEEAKVRENRKRDSKALFFIQQAVHETIFSRIAAATTSREAWLILQTEFQGSSRVVAVKLQTLRSEFETLQMKTGEAVQEYISRVTNIINQMRVFGDQISN